MQIRPLEDLTRGELIALILLERGQAEHIGAGGVPMMGDSGPGYMQIAFAQMKAIATKDAEIARLRYVIRDLLESHAVPSTACKERAAYEKAVAALTQQEQA